MGSSSGGLILQVLLELGARGLRLRVFQGAVEDVARRCEKVGLDFVVGGAVSIDAVTQLKRFRSVYLKRFETRKIVFDGCALEFEGLESALKDAVHFELLWLLNKREYYGVMYREDQSRIEMLEKRWQVLDK